MISKTLTNQTGLKLSIQIHYISNIIKGLNESRLTPTNDRWTDTDLAKKKTLKV